MRFAVPAVRVHVLLAVVAILYSYDRNIVGVNSFSYSKMMTMRNNKNQQRRKNSNATHKNMVSIVRLSMSTIENSESTAQQQQEILEKAREFAFQDLPLRSSSNTNNKSNNNVVITGDQYDLHYHSIDDEKAQIKKAKYWLNEIRLNTVNEQQIDDDGDDGNGVVAETVSKLNEIVKRHEKRLKIRTKGSDSVVPWISTELSIVSLIAVVVAFIVTLDIVALHGDDIGPIENYQQFFDIIKEKEYSIIDRFFSS